MDGLTALERILIAGTSPANDDTDRDTLLMVGKLRMEDPLVADYPQDIRRLAYLCYR